MYRQKRILAFLLALIVGLAPISTVYADNAESTIIEEVAQIETEVKYISKYGNITVAVSPKDFKAKGFDYGDIIEVTVGDTKLEMPFGKNYSDVDTKSLVTIHNYDEKHKDEENVIITAINMGNFSKTYGVKVGDKITYKMAKKAGYLDEYEIRQLTRTNDIEDYDNDREKFANFRPMNTSKIAKNMFYRSSNPINNVISRASYANKLVEEAGIKAVMNLADTPADIDGYSLKEDFKSEYYYKLFKDGKVIPLSMSVDISGKDFSEKLNRGVKFILQHEGPYLVHCNEGKDRAGFVAAVLEALAGSSFDEIVEDYMVTYENYYHVEKNSEQYDKIAQSNIITSMLQTVANVGKKTDPSTINWEEAAKRYFREDVKLAEEEITDLQNLLRTGQIKSDKEDSDEWSGKIREIEKYGHGQTDITIKDFLAMGYEFGDILEVEFDNGYKISGPFLDNYFVEQGEFLVRAYPGHEYVGLCINYGKLNEIAGIKPGSKFKISMKEKAGYLTQYEIRKLERSNDIKDYDNDPVKFANFRMLNNGNIRDKIIYRSSSPINNILGRASYADDLIKKHGIKYVINFSDNKEDIEKYIKAEDFNSPYYKDLYEKGNVLALNIGLAYKSDDFQQAMIQALEFIAKNEGPFLFHCIEGKDRTGYFGALVNALMGASKEEIVNDYMKTYENFYGVTKANKEKYDLIANDVLDMLKYITGSNDLDNINIQEKARAFVLEKGLSEKDLDLVIKRLSKVENIKVEVKKPAKASPKTNDFGIMTLTSNLVLLSALYLGTKNKKNKVK